MVGLSEDELNRRVDEAVAYVKSHETVTNILITGGEIEGLLLGVVGEHIKKFLVAVYPLRERHRDPGPERETVFKFHQSKDDADMARPFTRVLNPADTWLDGELNGI